jgi:predicted acetyltransferase
VHDHLWVRLIDLPAALAGRRYATDGGVLLDVTDTFGPWNGGRWLLEGGPDGAACRRAAGGPEEAVIALDASALASLYLGGTSVERLAAAGLVRGDQASLDRAGRLFGAGQDPWCSTYF